MGGIYQIRNTITGHVYIGSTNNFVQRKSDHFKQLRRGTHPSRHMQNAVHKYGMDALVFEKIRDCDDANLLIEEQDFIDERVTALGRKSLYNISCIAIRNEWTEESRAMLREKRIGERNPFFGKKHSAEAGAKMSASRKGRPTWNKGKKASEAHRAAISRGGIGRVQSDATKAKRSCTMKRLKAEGKLFGPSHVASMSAAQKARRIRDKQQNNI